MISKLSRLDKNAGANARGGGIIGESRLARKSASAIHRFVEFRVAFGRAKLIEHKFHCLDIIHGMK